MKTITLFIISLVFISCQGTSPDQTVPQINENVSESSQKIQVIQDVDFIDGSVYKSKCYAINDKYKIVEVTSSVNNGDVNIAVAEKVYTDSDCSTWYTQNYHYYSLVGENLTLLNSRISYGSNTAVANEGDCSISPLSLGVHYEITDTCSKYSAKDKNVVIERMNNYELEMFGEVLELI